MMSDSVTIILVLLLGILLSVAAAMIGYFYGYNDADIVGREQCSSIVEGIRVPSCGTGYSLRCYKTVAVVVR